MSERSAPDTSSAAELRRSLIEDLLITHLQQQSEEDIDDAEIVAQHPDLMPELGEQLQLLREIADQRVANEGREAECFAADSSSMRVRCPNCHETLRMSADASVTDIRCSQCGSRLSLANAPSKLPVAIGRYRIERFLGRGGFGSVYLAHDDMLDRLVAVKVPHAKLISKPEDAEAYLTEARTVANLDHPNIVPVHDVGSTEDCPCYVVSKYIEGTDLSARIKESRLKYREAAELVATVAEALHYAHKQGLVHRDVKPENILIGKDGQPFVVDFGLALREENSTLR